MIKKDAPENTIPDEFQVSGKAPAQTSNRAYKTYVSSQASEQHSQNLTVLSGTNLDSRSDPEGVKSRACPVLDTGTDFIKDEANKPLLTDFGFQTISTVEKTQRVKAVFRSVAGKYDMMNDLMSLGIHRWWKHYTLALANIRAGQTVLDLAGGTGDLAKKIARKVGDEGLVILADINDAMLAIGRDRLINAGLVTNICYTQVNAEQLPFADNTFDLITISFGLRNVTDKQAALQEMYRVLKPAGKLFILEFSKPTTETLQRVYDAYSFQLLPRLGKAIANDEASYRYLAESIRKHPDQITLQQMLVDAGFENCDYHNLTGGIVAIHRGYKY